ncbi:hypothetical protein [Mucilaginibacter hurinus]|nr:hypothetical protein [Mucilaginibacter hurinus]
MRNIFVLVVISILLTSCASVLNRRHKNVTIHLTNPAKIIYQGAPLGINSDKVTLTVLRSKEPLSLAVVTDSTKKEISITPHNSFGYYFNIVSNYGIGMLIDKNNPKRYTYPTNIYINPSDTNNRSIKYIRSQNKGALYLHTSLPHVNSFFLQPVGEGKKSNTGFFGLSLGLDYYHRQDHFLNLSAGAAADIFIPFPAPVRYAGEREFIYSLYLTASNNYNINRFSIGYGLAFTKNTWDNRYFGLRDSLATRQPITKSSTALGLAFPAYYRFGRSFQMGIIYKPTFISLTPGISSRYEHVISLDFAWKIRLQKGD